MQLSRHCTVALLTILISAAPVVRAVAQEPATPPPQAGTSPAAPASGAFIDGEAEFTLFLGGRHVGTEQVRVARAGSTSHHLLHRPVRSATERHVEPIRAQIHRRLAALGPPHRGDATRPHVRSHDFVRGHDRNQRHHPERRQHLQDGSDFRSNHRHSEQLLRRIRRPRRAPARRRTRYRPARVRGAFCRGEDQCEVDRRRAAEHSRRRARDQGLRAHDSES